MPRVARRAWRTECRRSESAPTSRPGSRRSTTTKWSRRKRSTNSSKISWASTTRIWVGEQKNNSPLFIFPSHLFFCVSSLSNLRVGRVSVEHDGICRGHRHLRPSWIRVHWRFHLRALGCHYWCEIRPAEISRCGLRRTTKINIWYKLLFPTNSANTFVQ